MDAILGFFKGIGDAIISVFDFVISFFGDVVYIVQLTGKFLVQIPTYFSWLPAPLLGIVVAVFGIVVIYKIMGREG